MHSVNFSIPLKPFPISCLFPYKLHFSWIQFVSMKNAACKEIDFNNEPIRRCIKIDGAWQKRGYVSLNGYVSGIIADKCVDVEVLSKFCQGCKMWESRKGSLKYKTWKLSHSCSII